MHYYCTYFDKKYLPKGLALLESMQRHIPDFYLFIVCMDEESHDVLKRMEIPHVELVSLSRVETAFAELVFARATRSLVEYYWTMTPYFISFFLQGLPQGTPLYYVDSDMYFFSTPEPVYAAMQHASVLIHKHNFSSLHTELTAYGTYNVGLMGFRQDAEGNKILDWWRKKCLEWCGSQIEADPEGGLRYGDQKYLEKFCDISSAVAVAEHPGIGVAPWNAMGYALDRRADGVPTVDGEAVVFYHYHAFFLFRDWCAVPSRISRYVTTLSAMKLFALPYLEALQRALEHIRAILPDYQDCFRDDILSESTSLLIRSELKDIFLEAGFTDVLPITGGFSVVMTSQMAEYRSIATKPIVAESEKPAQQLETMLQRYTRWEKKARLLNVGCGTHWHAAWLNIDIAPASPEVLPCDLRGTWPLPDDFFDAVYHSHVLEHMDSEEGKAFLHECYRVLKPGGILRIAIPDLEGIARAYLQALQEAREGQAGAADRHRWMILELIDQCARHQSGGAMVDYLRQNPVPEQDFILQRIGGEGRQLMQRLSGRAHGPSVQSQDAVAIGVFRLGGEVHRWMYDEYSLQISLQKHGFVNITRREAGVSDIAGFADFYLEKERDASVRKPDSLFMECRKPRINASFWSEAESVQAAMDFSARSVAGHEAKRHYFDAPTCENWAAAVAASTSYAHKEIFEKARLAARAVRDGKALWERDSVLFYQEWYPSNP